MSNVDRTKLILLQKYGTPSMKENASIVLKALQQTIKEDEVAVTKALLDESSQPLKHGTEYADAEEIFIDVQLKFPKSSKAAKKALFTHVLEQRIMGL